ncbi:hypothetical protein Sjap_000582 [Stephania japonica]|uniref:Uncharacterized protein n=1 Tax=Stephania japonica TaxID=461633 RepID=A0AAP0KIC3_9MAGN
MKTTIYNILSPNPNHKTNSHKLQFLSLTLSDYLGIFISIVNMPRLTPILVLTILFVVLLITSSTEARIIVRYKKNMEETKTKMKMALDNEDYSAALTTNKIYKARFRDRLLVSVPSPGVGH